MPLKLVFFIVALFTTQTWGDAGGRALVLIDMQPHFATRKGWHSNLDNFAASEAVLARQRRMIEAAKRHELPILVVEYILGGPTYQTVLDEIGSYWQHLLVPKNKDGLFDPKNLSLAALQRFLRAFDVTDLIIAGANGGACVRDTIAGALTAGYKVWADSKSIICFGKQAFQHPYVYGSGRFENFADRFVEGDVLQLLGLESPDATRECQNALATTLRR